MQENKVMGYRQLLYFRKNPLNFSVGHYGTFWKPLSKIVVKLLRKKGLRLRLRGRGDRKNLVGKYIRYENSGSPYLKKYNDYDAQSDIPISKSRYVSIYII